MPNKCNKDVEMMVSGKESGFSLVQIMLAVALMAVIAIVTVPKVSNYFTKTRAVGAEGAFSQYCDTVAIYANEHNGFGKKVKGDDVIKIMNKSLDPSYQISEDSADITTETVDSVEFKVFKSKDDALDPWQNPYRIYTNITDGSTTEAISKSGTFVFQSAGKDNVFSDLSISSDVIAIDETSGDSDDYICVYNYDASTEKSTIYEQGFSTNKGEELSEASKKMIQRK